MYVYIVYFDFQPFFDRMIPSSSFFWEGFPKLVSWVTPQVAADGLQGYTWYTFQVRSLVMQRTVATTCKWDWSKGQNEKKSATLHGWTMVDLSHRNPFCKFLGAHLGDFVV